MVMFNRKQSEEGEHGGTASRATPAEPARVAPPSRFDLPRRTPESGGHTASRSGSPIESKKLIVGPDISLHGHIASCDRLVVEGTVEAELTDCHTVEIAETGTFKGTSEIESAEVSGRYEGSLTVRGHLLIRSAGSVSGTVKYGRLEIMPGGLINGDVKALPESKRHEVANDASKEALGGAPVVAIAAGS